MAVSSKSIRVLMTAPSSGRSWISRAIEHWHSRIPLCADRRWGSAGTVIYTTVISALQTLLADQQAALTVQQNRLIASVTLIEALGGGWSTASL